MKKICITQEDKEQCTKHVMKELKNSRVLHLIERKKGKNYIK